MRIVFLLLFSFILFVTDADAAAADALSAADASIKKGDYIAALQLVQPLALQGTPDAQFRLGRLFENGYGLSQSYESAAAWYRKAADQGHAEAQCALGDLYRDGRGVAQDSKEAAKWYQMAASQGHHAAQANLGKSYYYGVGVKQDDAEAYFWLRISGAEGDALRMREDLEKRLTGEQMADLGRRAVQWTPSASGAAPAPAVVTEADVANAKGMDRVRKANAYILKTMGGAGRMEQHRKMTEEFLKVHAAESAAHDASFRKAVGKKALVSWTPFAGSTAGGGWNTDNPSITAALCSILRSPPPADAVKLLTQHHLVSYFHLGPGDFENCPSGSMELDAEGVMTVMYGITPLDIYAFPYSGPLYGALMAEAMKQKPRLYQFFVEKGTFYDQNSCSAGGGQWQKGQFTPFPACTFVFPDANKSCTDHADCYGGRCIVENKADGDAVTGTCSGTASMADGFGKCLCEVRNGSAVACSCLPAMK